MVVWLKYINHLIKLSAGDSWWPITPWIYLFSWSSYGIYIKADTASVDFSWLFCVFKPTSDGSMFYSMIGVFVVSTWTSLNWRVFLCTISRKKFILGEIQPSWWWPGFPQHSQIFLWKHLNYSITGSVDNVDAKFQIWSYECPYWFWCVWGWSEEISFFGAFINWRYCNSLCSVLKYRGYSLHANHRNILFLQAFLK